jgi:hypothetical protein
MMKLNELTGIKKYPKFDEEDLILDYNLNTYNYNINQKIDNFMKNLGFSFISNGTHAIVYKGKNSVIKIFSHDKPYEDWIKFVKLCPKKYKKYVPNVTSIKTYPNNKNLKFIKIELLSRLNDDEFEFLRHCIRSNNTEELKNFSSYKNNTTFYEFIKLLQRNSKTNDLGAENVMSRNGVLVVIDPWG